MNKVICTLTLLVVMTSFSMAQRYGDDGYNFKRNDPMGAGLYLGYKMGVNAAKVPNGIENGLGLAKMIDIGLEGYLPFDPASRMGLLFQLAYANYPYETSDVAGGDPRENNFTNIDLGVQFFISGFTVGVIAGFPAGGTLDVGDQSYDINSDGLATLFSLALGGHFNLLKTDMGRMILKIQGTYAVTGQLASDYNADNTSFNYHPASLMFGLGWIFDLENKKGPR
ncbi:MAG: hypothetical protein CVV22_09080 [Ignavibacteriae bacterium HGW-Ignavibacteriae-1]|jgi:hypothetical protein|nr:MAG: hypothetical protein CVV22_09080 [Ignavibacteriae bacterium HGW-Ignavibacteriae-1]